MRATRTLVAAAALAMAGLTVLAGATERDGSDADGRLLAAAAGQERDGWLDGFDGRLYADAETGCIHRWPGGGVDDVRREDADAPPRPAPEEHTVRVQGPPDGAVPDSALPDTPRRDTPRPDTPRPDTPMPEAPRPELAPPTLRGPWPLCEHPSSRVSDRLGDP
jgi:hypothetical protein